MIKLSSDHRLRAGGSWIVRQLTLPKCWIAAFVLDLKDFLSSKSSWRTRTSSSCTCEHSYTITENNVSHTLYASLCVWPQVTRTCQQLPLQLESLPSHPFSLPLFSAFPLSYHSPKSSFPCFFTLPLFSASSLSYHTPLSSSLSHPSSLFLFFPRSPFVYFHCMTPSVFHCCDPRLPTPRTSPPPGSV